MTKLLLAAALAWSGGAPAVSAELSDRDRAAIAALESRVVPLPGGIGSAQPASLAQRLAETRVPGVSVAFIENGRVKWTRAYGEAVAGSRRPVTPETRFQAASLSKAVAAAGALRLVDRGELTLDGNVNAGLKSWQVPAFQPSNGAGVTLRGLLSHTAGLTVAGYPGYARGAKVPSAAQSLAGVAPSNTPAVRAFAPPGKQFGYSGGGYTVAQQLMSDVTGTGFGPLMTRLVLRPAGMARSGYDQPLPKRQAASGHDDAGQPVPGGGNTYPELAAAGLSATPADYGRFLIALQNSWAGRPGALLSRASAQAMMTPVLADYGLGVTVLSRVGRTVITHGGANEGFRARFTAFLDGNREGLVIMTNGDNGGALAAGLQRTIASAYGWNDTSAPPGARAPD